MIIALGVIYGNSFPTLESKPTWYMSWQIYVQDSVVYSYKDFCRDESQTILLSKYYNSLSDTFILHYPGSMRGDCISKILVCNMAGEVIFEIDPEAGTQYLFQFRLDMLNTTISKNDQYKLFHSQKYHHKKEWEHNSPVFDFRWQ